MKPVTHARSCAPFALFTSALLSRRRVNPFTPPDTSIVAIMAPMTRVNMITFASPGSPSTATSSSIVTAIPTSGFQPLRIVHPSQTPPARDR